MSQQIIITKANGQKEPFDSSKLIRSLRRAGAQPLLIKSILTEIEKGLQDGMTTRRIYQQAFTLLKKGNTKPVAGLYSLRRAVMDLGPSGFPFEKFIGEIFIQKGYKVQIGRVIQGHCISHEIDVLAYNDAEVHLIEAKFHNNHGTKTDTKVALYIKSRFDDLRDVAIVIDKQERKMTDGWLITNTKFTQSAKQYAACQQLQIIGWDYPKKGNLHDFITEADLHPLTTLTTLSKAEKNLLLERGVVLLKHVKNNPEVLDVLGLSVQKKTKVLEEVKLICVHSDA